MLMTRFIQLFLFAVILFLSCAHQVGPPGGPKDTVPPQIVRAIPESGTLNHPVKKKIVLYFSEWVDIRNVKKSITVFPTLADGFKVTVGGKRVEIAPKKAFAESTTYHMGINTILTDLHGVSVGTPFKFFFSTGSTIDSGVITGCVIDAGKKEIQPKVALFRCENDSVSDTAFLELPSYLIQTDSSGFFQFDHIRKGGYILLAFHDEDNDNRITPGKDNAYAPREKKFVLEKEAGPFLLFPISSDTLSATVKEIKAISATLIFGEWIEDADYGMENNAWKILSLDSAVTAPRIRSYLPIRESRFFVLQLEDSLTTGSYSLIYTINPRIIKRSDSAGSDTGQVLCDTIRFNGTVYPDTVPPVLKGTSPKGTVDLAAEVSITWSKPVRALVHEWYITDSLDDTVKLSIDTSFSETSVFKPLRKLTPELTYTFSIPATYFEDFTGNIPRISSDTSKTDTTEIDTTEEEDTVTVVTTGFTTIAAKDICYSLSGGASCLEPQPLRIWEFKPIETSAVYTTEDSSNHFCFDSIPGGKGTFGYFIDYNNDNVYTVGSLFPWVPPEPQFAFPDTIEARARWDIEGVEVPACDICRKKKEQPAVLEEASPDTTEE